MNSPQPPGGNPTPPPPGNWNPTAPLPPPTRQWTGAPQQTGWNSAPRPESGFNPAPGPQPGWPPSPSAPLPRPTPPTGSGVRTGLIVAIAAVLVIAAGAGGFLLGRSTAPQSVRTASATESDSLSAGARTSAAPDVTEGITLTDSSSDAVSRPADGRYWGPSELTGMTLSTSGDQLVATLSFKPGTDMSLISTQIAIKTDPDRAQKCDFSVLSDMDVALDYDGDGRAGEILLPPSDCDGRWSTSSWALQSSVSGTTLTMRAQLSALGLRAGQRIQVRGCSSTRIDSTSTTTIQDYVPNQSSGFVGAI